MDNGLIIKERHIRVNAVSPGSIDTPGSVVFRLRHRPAYSSNGPQSGQMPSPFR